MTGYYNFCNSLDDVNVFLRKNADLLGLNQQFMWVPYNDGMMPVDTTYCVMNAESMLIAARIAKSSRRFRSQIDIPIIFRPLVSDFLLNPFLQFRRLIKISQGSLDFYKIHTFP